MQYSEPPRYMRISINEMCFSTCVTHQMFQLPPPERRLFLQHGVCEDVEHILDVGEHLLEAVTTAVGQRVLHVL